MKTIFFDGVCGLCNGFVDFVIRIDRKKAFVFSPLQSAYASSKLPQHLTQDLNSVVLLDNEDIYVKAKAVIMILTEVGGIWSWARFLNIIPGPLLNTLYDLVAKNRYQLFGKKSTCRIPSEEEKSRFVI